MGIREQAILSLAALNWGDVDQSLASRREGVDRLMSTDLGSQIAELLRPVSFSTVIIALSVALSDMRGDRPVRLLACAELCLSTFLMSELAVMAETMMVDEDDEDPAS